MTIITKNDFECHVNEEYKSVEFRPFKTISHSLPIPYPHCGKRRSTNPHMRGFWAATLAFMMAFIGWFAFAPLLVVVRKDIGLCDNDAVVQADIENAKCVCKAGCKATINNANIAGVLFDVFTRFILGAVIERLGPVMTDVLLLLWGAVVVGASAAVTNGTGLIIVRFFVSALGSTFVVNQFWNSILFAPNVIGTANATAGGWGNLGGGLTQTLMPLVYKFWHDGIGLSLSASWRLAMAVPATIFLFLAIWIYFCSQDMTTGKFDVTALGKMKKAGCKDYFDCLKDFRVFLMIMQYGACFGCELVMNVKLAMHFSDYFGVDLIYAGALAMSFGAMNLFARSLGGIASDWANARFGMPGRLWMHFLSLLLQAVFLFGFGLVTSDMGWPLALLMLVMMAIFVNAAEGTSYGIVPYMIPQQLAVVSAMVGAGGTLGAVIALQLFYRPAWVPETVDSFKIHSAYVLFWALTVPLMRWEHLGSMLGRPHSALAEAERLQKELKGVCDCSGASFAIYWGFVEHHGCLEPVAKFDSEDRHKQARLKGKSSLYTEDSAGTVNKPGEGVVGGVYESQDTAFFSDVITAEGFKRKDLALKYHVKSLAFTPWHEGVLEIGSLEQWSCMPETRDMSQKEMLKIMMKDVKEIKTKLGVSTETASLLQEGHEPKGDAEDKMKDVKEIKTKLDPTQQPMAV